MSEFEYVLIALLIPAVYILTYIAGKYDLLLFICKMLEESLEKYTDESGGENDNKLE